MKQNARLVRCAIGAAFALSLLSTSASPVSAADAQPLPDACGLVTEADLNALFPGQPVEKVDQTLSVLGQGPQYVQSCLYRVRLPNPRSSGTTASLISLTVLQLNGDQREFAHQFSAQTSYRDIRNSQVERVPEVADEALTDVNEREIVVIARDGKLMYRLTLDNYSAQSLPNALSLARQAADRWSDQDGMRTAAAPLAANTAVEIPPDTRESNQAPAQEWPDACALLTRADVEAVYAGAEIEGPEATRGQLTRMSRTNTSEDLPHPIACVFNVVERFLVDGKRELDVTRVRVAISDMARSPEIAERIFRIHAGDTDMPGLGDRASRNTTARSMAIQKGRLTVQLSAASARGARDQAIQDQDNQRLLALAQRVAPRMQP